MPTDASMTWAGMVRKVPKPSGESAGWAALERFLAQLDECGEADRQTRLLLDAVRDVTGAEVAAVVPDLPTDPVQVLGPARAAGEWVRDAVDRLLDLAPPTDSRYAAHTFDPAAVAEAFRAGGGPVPADAVLVRASGSRPAWVAALTLSADARLAPGAAGAIRLAARMLRGRQKAARYAADLSAALFGVVQGFAAAIDAKDPHTAGHSERVARMAAHIGRHMGLPAGAVSDLYLAGLLHDIGKIGVPDAVLAKPGRLTPAEVERVQAHPVIGDRILGGLRQLAPVRPGVRHHHERYDGLGYPDRLAGDAIPLLGRVLAVADTCDAMLSARPYRPALPPAAVEAELLKGRGSQWDPRVVDAFFACRWELYAARHGSTGGSIHAAVSDVAAAADQSRLPAAV